MSKNMNQLDRMNKDNPFKVPDGYFDGLTSQIMAGLPSKAHEAKTVSLWERIKPWTYMAAMFVGIALMVKIFVGSPSESDGMSTLNLTSSAEIEDFYNYYEEQLERKEYREALYAGEYDYLTDIE